MSLPCKRRGAFKTLNQLLKLSSALDLVKQKSPAGLLLQKVHCCGWQCDSRQYLHRSRCLVRHSCAPRPHACAVATSVPQLLRQTQALAGPPQGHDKTSLYRYLQSTVYEGMAVLYLHAADISEPHARPLRAAERRGSGRSLHT